MKYEWDDNIISLQTFCSEEIFRNNKYPASPQRRFAIGFYQIYQGVEWGRSASADESFVASAIHLLTVGEMIEIDIENHISLKITQIEYNRTPDFKYLLYVLSKAQSQVIYGTNHKGIKRKSRYKPELLAELLGRAITILFGMVEPGKRQLAVETAITIMTGVL